ncbi:hypothetical protein K2173_015179 [Erythroxylum novogranatense]|uniref:Phorbol-ester/DAG-type domain-containing protein n=1 Tax=Erythroxylum novogranatense TaxID=1862640 RepID=A0AAV8T180_9ROSI|nr:hypothetical protein K2173_015179 [Erythroxylum novogranatense]
MKRRFKRSWSFGFDPSSDDQREGQSPKKDVEERLERLLDMYKEEIDEGPLCNGCGNVILGPAYICETCEKFWLHESCASLPLRVESPLHLAHSLNLISKPPNQISHHFRFPEITYFFICDGCKDISPGFSYNCADCGFNLDVKCGLLDNVESPKLRKPEVEAKTYHPSHNHELVLFNYTGLLPRLKCYGCEMELQGLSYGCFECKLYLHKSCVELPSQIRHPCHPSHSLFLHHYQNRSSFICEGCRDISEGFCFQCESCPFQLDAKCALSMDKASMTSEMYCETKIRIKHFSHHHELVLFNCREDQSYTCTGCLMKVPGLVYGCFECKFYLHKSCAEMPREIQHPYHPFHPLRARVGKYAKMACQTCRIGTDDEEIVYYCNDCRFGLHMHCAEVSLLVISPLKHKCHVHNLYYKPRRFMRYTSKTKYGFHVCSICGETCEESGYICFECDCSFHLGCIPIPETVKYDGHMHSLTLRAPVSGVDYSLDYYCFDCEKERNPRYHAYYCDQCSYAAHIECALSEHLSNRTREKLLDDIFTEDFNNEHTMLSHAVQGLQQPYCYMCKESISRLAYTCQLCNIIFHKLCVEFPREIQHPLHSHPLLLFHVSFCDEYYVCNQCLNILRDEAYYQCEDCHFILHLNCASSRRDDDCPIPDQGDVSISHHSHHHKLRLANCPIESFIRCHICSRYISGPLFCCLQCAFFIHKSCREAPKEIEHQFHPEHSVRWSLLVMKTPKCKVCNWSTPSINSRIYTCEDCEFHIDYNCANYLTSSIKLKNHAHKFFYFLAVDLSSHFKCKVCGKNCIGSFYRCLECDMNLHLSQCHCHPLTLEYSVINECYEEEYCHECEDLRNADHAVYYCENCHYTAHIGCALDQVRFLSISLFFTLLSYSSPQLDMHSFLLNCSRTQIR